MRTEIHTTPGQDKYRRRRPGDLRLFAVVLAAGRGRRFGAVKQLALYRGLPLAARAVREAEALCGEHTVLVTGCEGAAVHAACAPLAGFRVHNSEFDDGLASSIAAGVAPVAAAADGVLLMLSDQPLVDRRHLAALATAWRAAPDLPVASGYAGAFGVPAIFPRADFAALMALEGDHGAQRLLARAHEHLQVIECEAAGIDVDRPEELEALAPPQD